MRNLARRGGRLAVDECRRDRSSSRCTNPGLNTLIAAPRSKPAAGQTRDRLIVGIDLGTTKSCAASARTSSQPNIHDPKTKIRQFAGYKNGESDPHPETHMYYFDNLSPITGNLLTLRLKNPEEPMDPDRLLRSWKLLFHPSDEDIAAAEIQTELWRKLRKMNKSRKDVMLDWAVLQLEDLFGGAQSSMTSLRSRYPNLDNMDVDIVLAVPPSRSQLDHAEVKEAFSEALAPFQKANSWNVSFSFDSEPAAMFYGWAEDAGPDHLWQVGKTYLSVDGGGAHLCFARFLVKNNDPIRFAQEVVNDSVACGSETISNNFRNLLCRKLKKSESENAWLIDSLRRTFDTVIKMDFEKKLKKKWPLYNHLASDKNNTLMFSEEEIESCFKPCLEKIFDGLLSQLGAGGKVDYIVLGGGLFQSKYIRKAVEAFLQEKFPWVTVCELAHCKNFVARGAVYSRISGGFVSQYCYPKTKGLEKLMEVDNVIKSLPFYESLEKLDKDDKKTWIVIAEYLVKKGTMSSEEQTIVMSSDKKDLQKRYVTPQRTTFTETIHSFDYEPGLDNWAYKTKEGTWVNQLGQKVQCDLPEEYTWSLPSLIDKSSGQRGITLADLDTKSKSANTRYPLYYQLDINARESWTTCRVIIKSTGKMRRKYGNRVVFEAESSTLKPLYGTTEISPGLDEAFTLEGASTRIRDERSTVSQPPNHLNLPASSRITRAGPKRPYEFETSPEEISEVGSVVQHDGDLLDGIYRSEEETARLKRQRKTPKRNFHHQSLMQ